MWNGSLKPVLGSQLQLGHPLAQGLVGCWLMNEGAGTIAHDLSGNKNDGILTSASWLAGGFGSSLSWSGSGSADMGSESPLDIGTKDFTISIWFRTSDATDYQGLVRKYGSNFGFRISMRSDGRIYHLLYDDISLTASSLGSGGWNDGLWHHLVMSYHRSSFVRLYIDGIYQAFDDISATSGSIDNSSNYLLADGQVANLTGQISHHGLYIGKALSASEIVSLYREPFQMFDQEPIELWTAAMAGAAPPADEFIWNNLVTIG